MTNVKNTKMNSKSLALKNDSHLKELDRHIVIIDDTIVVNGYAYIDFETVSGGALFFFVPFDKWITQKYNEKEDLKEVFVEFEEQRLYSEAYDYDRGIIQGERYRLIDNDHEAFDLDEGLKDAELKAMRYIMGSK